LLLLKLINAAYKINGAEEIAATLRIYLLGEVLSG